MGISYAGVSRTNAVLQTATNQQIGSAPAATNPMALCVEQYTGHVEGTIARASVMRSYVPTRNVRGTSTISEYRFGQSQLQTLTPGVTPDATINQASKNILTIDTVVLARGQTFLLDEFQSSYDARKQIGEEHGKIISKFYDQAFLIQAIKAARVTDVSGFPSGWYPGTQQALPAAGDENDPAKLLHGVNRMVAQVLEKDVDPQVDGFGIFLKPSLFMTLLENQQIIQREFITADDTKIAGWALKLYDIPVWTTNNLPQSAITGHRLSNVGNGNAYDGDFSNVLAVGFNPRALLAGETIPLTTEVYWHELSKTHFIDAYLSFGVTTSNPAFAAVLTKTV